MGAHRAVPIAVTVKGCRAPFKFYTDLTLDARQLGVCHGQGLEATLALVGLAGKRLRWVWMGGWVGVGRWVGGRVGGAGRQAPEVGVGGWAGWLAGKRVGCC